MPPPPQRRLDWEKMRGGVATGDDGAGVGLTADGAGAAGVQGAAAAAETRTNTSRRPFAATAAAAPWHPPAHAHAGIPTSPSMDWTRARGGAVSADDGRAGDASVGSTNDGVRGDSIIADEVILLGLGVKYPDIAKAKIEAVYSEQRDSCALGETIPVVSYLLSQEQDKMILRALRDEFEPMLLRTEVYNELNRGRTQEVDAVRATLRAMVFMKERNNGRMGEMSAEDMQLKELFSEYSPTIQEHTVLYYFYRSEKISWRTRLHVDAFRRRNDLAPVPFVEIEISEGASTTTVEDRDAKYSAAHEPLRQMVRESRLLTEKAEKAEGDGDTGVAAAAWLRAEAERIREEERVKGLEVAFHFFDDVVSSEFCKFVTDSSRVVAALDLRNRNAQEALSAHSESAMFSLDLHMQRGQEVAAVLDRALGMIVRAYPAERIAELLDVSIDVLFGKGSHSDQEKGPTLPRSVTQWLRVRDFLVHSKDVVTTSKRVLYGYRLAARPCRGEQDRENRIARFSAMREYYLASRWS